MLEQASQLRLQYREKLQAEIDKLRSPIRPPSSSSSLLSYEAAEFIPSSSPNLPLPLPQSDYYNYYQQAEYLPALYPQYQPSYCYNQATLTYEHPAHQTRTDCETNVWSNMLDILKNA